MVSSDPATSTVISEVSTISVIALPKIPTVASTPSSSTSSTLVISTLTPGVLLTYSSSIMGSLPFELPFASHVAAGASVAFSPSVMTTPALSTRPLVSLPDTDLTPLHVMHH